MSVYLLGLYPTGVPSLCRYLYITIVYNVTYSVALLALFMFYMGAHDLLAPFNPLLKFVLVKSVVFFTFWQVLAAWSKVLDSWWSFFAGNACSAATVEAATKAHSVECGAMGTTCWHSCMPYIHIQCYISLHVGDPHCHFGRHGRH